MTDPGVRRTQNSRSRALPPTPSRSDSPPTRTGGASIAVTAARSSRHRCDRVADVHVEPEPHRGGRDAAVHRDLSHPGVTRPRDRPGDRGVGDELDAIIDGPAGRLCDPHDDGVLVIGDVPGERINVGRGTARMVGHEQHAALEDDALTQSRRRRKTGKASRGSLRASWISAPDPLRRIALVRGEAQSRVPVALRPQWRRRTLRRRVVGQHAR